jgi:hypothetical protein
MSTSLTGRKECDDKFGRFQPEHFKEDRSERRLIEDRYSLALVVAYRALLRAHSHFDFNASHVYMNAGKDEKKKKKNRND